MQGLAIGPDAGALTFLLLRSYEDNFDAVNNLAVLVEKTTSSKIEDYGAPEKFLEKVSYLLGKQAYSGEQRAAV